MDACCMQTAVTTCHVDDMQVLYQVMYQVMYQVIPAVCRRLLLHVM